MSTQADSERGRPSGRNENLFQEASAHDKHEAREDARKRKAQAQAQASRSFPAGQSKADPRMSQEAFASCSETANKLFPPALFSDDGLLTLAPNSNFLLPTPELTSGNASREAPDQCDGCTGPPANQQDDDLPRPPPPGQPPFQKEHVPKPAIEYDVDTNRRIATLDKDTRTLVKSYGGYPLNNQLRVLEMVEKWQADHGRTLMDVERKDGKGGVLSVTCNVCLAITPDMLPKDAQHKTVQKAAEHIISFHWELSAWSCIRVGCGKVFRRKQECDRHEESHGFVTKKKEKKIANQQATGNTVPPPLSNPLHNPVPTAAPQKSRIKRHEAGPPAAFLAPPSTSGGPVRPRSREPSPHRHAPYLHPTRSAPDLSVLPTQPSTSTVPYGHDRAPSYPAPSPPTVIEPPPQLTLNNYGEPSYPPPTTVPPSQSRVFRTHQGYPGQAPLLRPYSQDPFGPPQGGHIAQMLGPSLPSGTRPAQLQFMPPAAYGPPRMASYGMQSGQPPQQYAYPQPPMHITRTTQTPAHQSGQTTFQLNGPPYDWDYQANY